MKICQRCKTAKAFTEFHKDKKKKDGHCSWCIQCKKDYYDGPDGWNIKAAAKQWRLENKERISATNKVWAAKNKALLKRKRYEYTRRPSTRYQVARSNAKAREYEFTITLEEYLTLIKENVCEYCKGPLPETGGGVDRKDNSQGYHLWNLVPCCSRCNDMKSVYLTYNEMHMIWTIRRQV